MIYESRLLAGILMIVLPTVMIGEVSILSLLISDPTYMENSLRQDLWRAGHAHADVWLIPVPVLRWLVGRVQALRPRVSLIRACSGELDITHSLSARITLQRCIVFPKFVKDRLASRCSGSATAQARLEAG